MKKSFLMWVIQLLTMPVLGQQNDFKKNSIGFESGFYNRSLLGLSYSRNVQLKDDVSFSTEFSAGYGIGWDDHTNLYASVSPIFNFGDGNSKFLLGTDLKYYDVTLFDGNIYILGTPKPRPNYAGITTCPTLGFSFNRNSGFFLKVRGSVMPVIQNDEVIRILPGAGWSIGASF